MRLHNRFLICHVLTWKKDMKFANFYAERVKSAAASHPPMTTWRRALDHLRSKGSRLISALCLRA